VLIPPPDSTPVTFLQANETARIDAEMSASTFISRAMVVALLALMIQSCAGSAGRANELATERSVTVGTDCFFVSQARDFRNLDDRNLIVFAPRNQPFHVELASGCFGLRGSSIIALRSRTDRMCGFGGDAVVVDGALPERCPVLGVTRLDEDGLRLLLERFEADSGEPGGQFETEIPVRED
jgi:hypothetical protein